MMSFFDFSVKVISVWQKKYGLWHPSVNQYENMFMPFIHKCILFYQHTTKQKPDGLLLYFRYFGNNAISFWKTVKNGHLKFQTTRFPQNREYTKYGPIDDDNWAYYAIMYWLVGSTYTKDTATVAAITDFMRKHHLVREGFRPYYGIMGPVVDQRLDRLIIPANRWHTS